MKKFEAQAPVDTPITPETPTQYERPVIEEHRIVDKVAACNQFSQRYVSGYGYWH